MRKGNRQTKLLEKDMPIRLNREDMNVSVDGKFEKSWKKKLKGK